MKKSKCKFCNKKLTAKDYYEMCVKCSIIWRDGYSEALATKTSFFTGGAIQIYGIKRRNK